MPLEDVVREILEKAEREKRKILDEARKEAEAIVNEAEKKAKARLVQFRKETESIIGELEKKNAATTDLKIKEMTLLARKEIIDRIFEKFAGSVSRMSAKERADVISRLLKKASSDIEVAFVYGNSDDKGILSKSKDYKFGGTIDTLGGLIAENKERSIRANYTFETFIEKLREAYIGEVAERVFKADR